MGKLTVAIFAVISLQIAAGSSPAFLWNVKSSFPSVLNSDEFSQNLASVKKSSLAVFIRDELSMEDFSVNRASLANIAQLAKTYEKHVAFIPSLEDPVHLVQSLKQADYQIVNLKENDKTIPETSSDKVAFVIRLQGKGTESLKKNDAVIGSLFNKLKEKLPNTVGVFVGYDNPVDSLEHKRVARSLLSLNEDFPGEFYNVSGEIFMFLENRPQLQIYADDKSVYNFTLGTAGASGTTNTSEATLSLAYKDVSAENATLTSANIEFIFTMKRGKWSLTNGTISFVAEVSGKQYRNTLPIKPVDITTPRGFSYHCSRRQLVKPIVGESDNFTAIFELRGVQLQPFAIKKDRFGDWYDCEGFFSVGIWAGILLGLMIAAILGWAVSMLADIKTPDRFDDPKGKTITINATE